MAKISWSWVITPSSKRITEFQVHHNPHHSLLLYTGPASVIYSICLIPEGVCECSPWFWYLSSLCCWLYRTKPGAVTEESTRWGGPGKFSLSFLSWQNEVEQTTKLDWQEREVGPKPHNWGRVTRLPFPQNHPLTSESEAFCDAERLWIPCGWAAWAPCTAESSVYPCLVHSCN